MKKTLRTPHQTWKYKKTSLPKITRCHAFSIGHTSSSQLYTRWVDLTHLPSIDVHMNTGHLIKVLVGGWATPPEKYKFVNWDDDIPSIWENTSHVPNHQPEQGVAMFSPPNPRWRRWSLSVSRTTILADFRWVELKPMGFIQHSFIV